MGLCGGKESGSLERPNQGILTVYGDYFTSETRTLMNIIKLGDVKCEFTEVDLFKGDHKKEQYLKLNPTGSLPTISEGRFLIIGGYIVFVNYLVNHHRPIRDKLYP